MFKAKKIITTLILFVCLVISFCLVSFAEDSESIVSSDFREWTLDSASNLTPTITYSNGVSKIRFTNNNSEMYATYYTIPSFLYNHEFVLSFSLSGNFSAIGLIVCLVNGDISLSEDYYILGEFSSLISNNSPTTVTYTFNPSSLFSDISNLRLYFDFDGSGTASSYTLSIYDLSLVDNTPSVSDGLSSAITSTIQPILSFVNSHVNLFFYHIESSWMYLFVWYVLNAGFIIFVVGRSIFDWVDIVQEGTFELGLNMLRKNKFDRYYSEKKEQAVKEAEIRYNERKAERESKLHNLGGSGTFSNSELAKAYFEKFPNRYSITISGHKFFNMALLENAKKDSDRKNNKNSKNDN